METHEDLIEDSNKCLTSEKLMSTDVGFKIACIIKKYDFKDEALRELIKLPLVFINAFNIDYCDFKLSESELAEIVTRLNKVLKVK